MHAVAQTFSRRQFFKMTMGSAMLATGFIAFPADAAKLNLTGGVAIKGYDPVAYFSENSAVTGDASISTEYEGATYQFANAENRDAFVENPVKYAPQYGGYCAFAASKNAIAPVDPEAFSVVDEKLYLNFSKTVRTVWSEDIPGNISLADGYWPGLSAN